ncbi:MAG: toll/interleukin-1 receptor domain-containing protein [Bryobacterales bacterium]|nr:toll/interleukin-1 receptor domain-containing protein [Bryobacterales bacterium]
MIPPPTLFISYSWDSPEHEAWVEVFAAKLRAQRIDAKLDKWEVEPGEHLTRFMEQGVAESSFVFSICTPNYKAKFDGRFGGTGYEAQLITGEALNRQLAGKFVPVLRSGVKESSIPNFYAGALFIDLRSDSPTEFEKILGKVKGTLKKAPVLGSEAPFQPERPLTSPGIEFSSAGPLRVELYLITSGLAVRVHNEDIRPHSNCEVIVAGVNRFSEKVGAFTENPMEPFRILREKSIKGDGQSAGYLFGTLGPEALSLTSCGRERNRTTGFPEINKAGVWKLDLRVNSSEISEVAQEFFVAWEPGQAPMLLPAPTESRSVLSSHDDARTETAGTGGGFTSVPAWRKQLVSSVRIRLRPIFPQIYESDELIVRDVTDEWLSIEKPGSGQGLLLPCSRVLGVVRMSDGDPYVVDLNGRMQLITSTRSWRFFLERPDTPDERRFGLCKVSSLKDPKAIAIIDKLTSFGIESRFTSLRNIGDRTAHGWQIVYDEDGRYFRVSGGGGDDLVLMACFAE